METSREGGEGSNGMGGGRDLNYKQADNIVQHVKMNQLTDAGSGEYQKQKAMQVEMFMFGTLGALLGQFPRYIA